MRLLLVDACPRGGESRTLRLAEALLGEVRKLLPDVEVRQHTLSQMGLKTMDAQTLAFRERLCDEQDWADPLLAPAVDFQSADAVLIAAPYWDLSFPAVLKIWVENMWVRNLTFVYRQDEPVGLCRGRVCAYVTTSGSPIGAQDFGTDYIRCVMQTLGIPHFLRLSAEGLDTEGADVEAIMRAAKEKTKALALAFERLLRPGE